MKWLVTVLTFLMLTSFCFAVVNDGINTRNSYAYVTWPVMDTVVTDTSGIGGTPEDSLYAIDTIGYAIFDLRPLDEQGWPVIIALADSSDSLDVWFCTGHEWNPGQHINLDRTKWADSLQCLWDYRTTAGAQTDAMNLAFLQSLALVDTTDYNTGFMVGDYLKIIVLRKGVSRDTLSVESGNGTWPWYRGGNYTDIYIKGYFK